MTINNFKTFNPKKVFTMDEVIKTIIGCEFNTAIHSIHEQINYNIEQYKNKINSFKNTCCVTTVGPAVSDQSAR